MAENTDKMVEVLLNASGITVIVGAGISVAAGIASFRGPHGQHGGRFEGFNVKDLFDYHQMAGRARQVHNKYVANLTKLAVQARPTEFHKLLRLLDDCGMLARLYTQNIDGLEAKVGFDLFSDTITRKCVLLHGSISTLRCEKCGAVVMAENYLSSLDFGESIACPGCIKNQDQDHASGKRPKTPGDLRPNILLYHEASPVEEDIRNMVLHDASSLRDKHVLLICGTSLQIPGVKTIIHAFKNAMGGRLGCHIIYVDSSSNTPAVLPDCASHIQLDCQEFATTVISKVKRLNSQQQKAIRRDFRPIWNWH